MFDSEDLSLCLNAMYEAGINDDMLAIIFEANKTISFAVKTPNGVTKTRKIERKVMFLLHLYQIIW